MLTVEHSMREFLNSVTIVRWEWILATIILVFRFIGSRLESRSHETLNAQPEPRLPCEACRAKQGNTQHATRNYVP